MPVSFSAAAKAEVCRTVPQRRCCALAECFGILLYCNTFTADCVKIVTESQEFGQLLQKLFKKAFGFSFDTLPEAGCAGKQVFELKTREKLDRILEAYGFSREETLALHLNLAVIEEDCCKTSFLRGAFLAGGSVTDPAKGYHLEMATGHQFVARETDTLMEEVLGFYPKVAPRGGNAVLYLKQNEKIADFLAYLGAGVAAMALIETKLEKEMNNKVNRRCNCDDANISKVVDAAQQQLAAIRVLRECGAADHLPEKLMQAMVAREENPESNLTELAGKMEPPISKPAMSHRLQRLVQMAQEVKEV